MDILLAEDDLLTCQLLSDALEGMGHTVCVTTNGLDAWNMHDAQPRSIIVSDWDMPEIDGLDLCKKVRLRSSEFYTYFIMLTAKTDKEDFVQAMDAGVDDFLVKPLDRQMLSIRLRVAERIIKFRRELTALKEIVPICSYCKKIRKDADYWEKLEIYLEANLERDVSHSICPDCFAKQVEPQFEALEKRKAMPDS